MPPSSGRAAAPGVTSAGANAGSWRPHQEQLLDFVLPDPAGAADPTGGSLG